MASGNFFSAFFFDNRTPKSVCLNLTVVQLYVNQTLPVIKALQANSTYNPVLQLNWYNFITYLQNTTNQALSQTNCTTFVANLKAAKQADKDAISARENIDFNIEKLFRQVARNATGNNGPNDFDSGENRY